MPDEPVITPLAWTHAPLEVAAAWPLDRPLMMLHSGQPHQRWGRWSILASPEATYRFDGRSRWIGQAPREAAHVQFTHEALRDLESIFEATALPPDAAPMPFRGGWIGCFSYDLGRIIEPKAQAGGVVGDGDWPLIELAWCPWAFVHDAIDERWFCVGEPPSDCRDEIDDCRLRLRAPGEWHSGSLQPQVSPDEYLQAVEQTIDYIRAGDIFQANIAQRFSASFDGSARAFGLHALRTSGARYGALLEFAPGSNGRMLISLSPELFLQIDGVSRGIVTRPIKGTRPRGVDPLELEQSEKDAAELHMIVDLMRNDLGRVCEFGSVRVPHPRLIESYPTVHHGVAEIVGRLRPGMGIVDVLRATFPGGSVTGAPKIRAMQIIDELERTRRGPYCGAIGCLSRHGDACLNIAIRTIMLSGTRPRDRWDVLDGRMDYSVGCGIVADSDPLAEYRESLDKAAVLRLALEQREVQTTH